MALSFTDRKFVLFLIFSITLISALGLASVTPALPRIAKDLAVAEDRIGLIFAVFALPSLILTPILGVLADRFGRKLVLVPSLTLFSLAGSACFFAPNFSWLLAFRFLEGCGASSLGALNVTLIGDLFSEDEQAKLMGYNNGVLSIGTAILPILGGALAQYGWNYPFLLSLFALPIAALIFARLDNIKAERASSVKTYFSEVKDGIKSWKIIGLLALSAISFILLFGAFLTYLPFVINTNFTFESLKIGLVISSMSVFQALSSAFLGRMLKVFSKATLLKVAFFAYAASLVTIPLMPSLYMLLIPTLLFGLAHGINIPIVQSLLAERFPTSRRAFFMSINRMVAQFGQASGPLLMGFVLKSFGLSAVFSVSSAIAAFVMIALVAFIKDRKQLKKK